jgi:hypothetical protein
MAIENSTNHLNTFNQERLKQMIAMTAKRCREHEAKKAEELRIKEEKRKQLLKLKRAVEEKLAEDERMEEVSSELELASLVEESKGKAEAEHQKAEYDGVETESAHEAMGKPEPKQNCGGSQQVCQNLRLIRQEE